MDPIMILARLLHIGLGVFWAGTAMFIAAYLNPAMADAGPDGAKVGLGLVGRGFLNIFPATAIGTVLSGFYLLGKAASGTPGYMGTTPGITYSIGMLSALGALFVGLTRIRPSMLRVAALVPTIGAAPAADRERIMAEMQELRGRATRGGRAVAWMLAIAVATMAVGRYL